MSNLTDTFYAAEGGSHGYGAQLLVGDGGSPETFEAVAEVTKITPGDMTTAVIERTHLRSPQAHREKMAGLRDSGPFSLELNYRPGHESQNNAGGGAGSFSGGGLAAKWRARTTHNFRIELNDGSPATVFPFTGFISKYQLGEIGPDSSIKLMVEITPRSDFSADLP